MRSEKQREAIRRVNEAKRLYPKEHGPNKRLHNIWKDMKARCYNKNAKPYPRYGGRGILVCDEWLGYGGFLQWALASGYSPELEVDRKDNDLGYSPQNCRWTTRSTNQRNKRDNRAPVAAFGEVKTPIEWSEDGRCMVGYRTLLKRLDAGWSPEIALTTKSTGWGKAHRHYAAGL